MGTGVVVDPKKRVLNLIAIHALGVARVKDEGVVNDEFVAIQPFIQFNINRPHAIAQGHVQPCIPVPLADQLDGLPRPVVRQRGGR